MRKNLFVCFFPQIRCLLWMFPESFFASDDSVLLTSTKKLSNFHVDCEACMSLNAAEIAFKTLIFIYCIFIFQHWNFSALWNAQLNSTFPKIYRSQSRKFPTEITISCFASSHFLFRFLQPSKCEMFHVGSHNRFSSWILHPYTLMFTPKTGICGNCLNHK